MKNFFLLMTLFSLVFTNSLFSQRLIEGTVYAENNEPLVGANIILKGTTQGTISDIDGHYSIKIPQEASTLIASFVGYESQEISINATNKMDIQLKNGLMLSQLDIIGYIGGCRCPLMCDMGAPIISSTFCCGGCRCPCLRYFIEDVKNPLTYTPLSNGSTLLTYQIDILSKNATCYSYRNFEDKKVQYDIYISTDGDNYQRIGSSLSDSTRVLSHTPKGIELVYGGSQFLDKNVHSTDTVYYKVEGYLVPVEEEDYEEKNDDEIDETPAKEYVFSQIIKVPPVEVLKISHLYASNILDLGLLSPQEQETDFIVSDMSGQVLLKSKQYLMKKQNNVQLPISDLISGTYVLSVRQGTQVDARKFVVVK